MSCCQDKILNLCNIAVCPGEPITIKTPVNQLPFEFSRFYAEVTFKNSTIRIDPVPVESLVPQPLIFVLEKPNEKYCYKMVVWENDNVVIGNRKIVTFEQDGQVYNAIGFCTIYKKSNC